MNEQSSKLTKVGYIGLGNIGLPSARRLLGGRFEARVFDQYQPPVDELAAEGAIACSSLAELAAESQHIGVCVRDDADVESLLFANGGIFANARAGARISIHSTVTRAHLLRWSEEASRRGMRLIDAPITGGAHRAAEGKLCYMVGGNEDDLAAVTPIFMTSAEKVVHAGAVGAGITLKLCNNFMQYAEFVAMAEAVRLAETCGLPMEKLREVGLSNGVVNEQMHLFASGRNSLAQTASEEDMEAFFGAMGRLGQKDLQCAISTAREQDVRMPLADYLVARIEDVFLAKDPSRPAQKTQ